MSCHHLFISFSSKCPKIVFSIQIFIEICFPRNLQEIPEDLRGRSSNHRQKGGLPRDGARRHAPHGLGGLSRCVAMSIQLGEIPMIHGFWNKIESQSPIMSYTIFDWSHILLTLFWFLSSKWCVWPPLGFSWGTGPYPSSCLIDSQPSISTWDLWCQYMPTPTTTPANQNHHNHRHSPVFRCTTEQVLAPWSISTAPRLTPFASWSWTHVSRWNTPWPKPSPGSTCPPPSCTLPWAFRSTTSQTSGTWAMLKIDGWKKGVVLTGLERRDGLNTNKGFYYPTWFVGYYNRLPQTGVLPRLKSTMGIPVEPSRWKGMTGSSKVVSHCSSVI